MLRFQVKDMSCDHCANAITQAVQLVDSNAVVEIDLATHQVSVDGAVDHKKVAEAIRDAGYTPVLQK